MKRRDFLKKTGVVAASTAFSPLMFASAQAGTFRLELVSSFPGSLDIIYGGGETVAQALNDLTGGDVQVTVYPAGAQIGGLEVYDAVSSGAFALGHSAAYYYTGRDLAHAFFTAVPFGLTAQQHNAWLIAGGGQVLWDEINARDNLIAFAAGNTGTQMGGWFRREINTLEDLRGLTMRVPGFGGEVMSRAGVNVQNLPGGEIFLALDTGVIDATEWVGPYDDEILGLNQAAPYYYGPAWQEPGATLCLYVNLDTYNSFPPEVQTALRLAAQSANETMLSRYEAENGPALQRLVDTGTEVRTFSPEILAALQGYMESIHETNAAGNEFYARTLESFSIFRDSVRDWNRQAQYAFQNFVYTQEEQG